MKYTHNWPVTTDGSDCSGRMSLPYLCNLLQETATLHADKLGWGYDVLVEDNLQWVLSRQWIRMDRYPRWKDEVTVTTWPSGRGGITWNREFIISDKDGNRLGIATSLWFVMHRETRRPRPVKLGSGLDLDSSERVREADLKPLPALAAPRPAGTVKASHFDIDIHNHINNLRYLTWMTNALEPELLDSSVAKEVEINFLMEGFRGDLLEVNTDGTAAGGQERLQNLVRKEDGRELSRMKTTWESV